VARPPRYGGRRHAVCNVSPPVCAGDWGDNTCVTQDSTHIYMCDDLGEDVTTNLATRPQAQVKYTARVAHDGDSSVDAAECTECHLDRSGKQVLSGSHRQVSSDYVLPNICIIIFTSRAPSNHKNPRTLIPQKFAAEIQRLYLHLTYLHSAFLH
jgi:hypothetical protein